MIKKSLRYALLFGLTIVTGILLFLLYSTLTEFRPDDRILLQKSKDAKCLSGLDIYSMITWNIGYAGLGEKMDFFYDGGTKVRDTKENVERNLQAINTFLAEHNSADFILLQEIDLNSKRSYRINEYRSISAVLKYFPGYFGKNYKADFVPVPIYSPLGKVESGIAIFSKHQPLMVERIASGGNFGWPKSLYMLKRCFLVSRFCINDGKEIVVINTHNSAFDDGSLRAEQVKSLETFAKQEFNRGNYVVLGGDWNQCPSGFVPQYSQPFDTIDLSFIPEDFLAGWANSFIPDKPTNRRVDMPYDSLKTLTTTIDYFFTSPNINVISVELKDLSFKNSDHQPLILTFKLGSNAR